MQTPRLFRLVSHLVRAQTNGQTIAKLLICNRGEISIRIARACAEMGIKSVAIFSEDDAASLHRYKTDEACPLEAGKGAAAYLNIDAIIRVAKSSGCTAVHPGYGFLSENSEFAARCEQEGIIFVGPTSQTIALFGDKTKARAAAKEAGVQMLPGTVDTVDLQGAQTFFSTLGGAPMMIKAVAGGGGRGMRAVFNAADVSEAYDRCTSEAGSAFGDGRVFVEQLMVRPRHLEVQVLGDGTGEVTHLYERECSLQRQNQKVK
jgi:pyruvate carboxylase